MAGERPRAQRGRVGLRDVRIPVSSEAEGKRPRRPFGQRAVPDEGNKLLEFLELPSRLDLATQPIIDIRTTTTIMGMMIEASGGPMEGA